MNQHVEDIFNLIVAKFKTGEIAESIAMACFPAPEAPFKSWSFTNRTIMFLSGTGDARGYRQWKLVDRFVKKGSHPVYILAPCFKKEVDEDTGEKQRVLSNFSAIPVFRYEDTGGEELSLTSFEVPLQLRRRADKLGVEIYGAAESYSFYNYYSQNRKGWSVASADEIKFFWGLAKSALCELQNGGNQNMGLFYEAVVDLCAQALCSSVGKRTDGDFKGAFQQIDLCAREANKSVRYSCLYVLSEAERVLNYVFRGEKSVLN